MEEKGKYKIIFDTNIIMQSGLGNDALFNNNLKDINEFIIDNSINKRVLLAITETVKDERIFQINFQIDNYIKQTNEINNFTKKIGLRKKISLSRVLMKKNAKQDFIKYLSELKIQVIKNPKIDKNILFRSTSRIKPFSDKGDKGFRDTLIWLSILNDAKNNEKTNYIFCSNNTTDFDDATLSEEFSKYSNAQFIYVKNLDELKVYLDKEIKLNLKLKERNEKISQEIKQRIGDVMVEFNKVMLTNNPMKYRYILNNNADNNIIGYNFKDISIENIQESKNSEYIIQASLFAQERLKNKDSENDYIINTRARLGLFEKSRLFHIYILYNKIADTIFVNTSSYDPMFFDYSSNISD